MKYALISEEQIKSLRQYLLNQPINSGCVELCEMLMSLKPQKPVAYEHRKRDKQSPTTIIQFTQGSRNPFAEHTLSKTRYDLTTTALYALRESND